jgi:hypothetical protein
MNWQTALRTAATAAPAPQPETDRDAVAQSYIAQLRTAAEAWDRRAAQVSDGFAQGKGAVCRDIADKLERFGSFASPKQQDYAMKLVAWTQPKQTELPPTAPASTAASTLTVPKLFAVMQRHAKFLTERVEIRRKNQDSLCWLVAGEICIGKIDNAVVTLFGKRILAAGLLSQTVLDVLAQIERDPEAAAREFGKLSGRCAFCGRDLTDPDSIMYGIGPVCRARGF